MQQHGDFFRPATRRAIFWTLAVGSGLAASLVGTFAIAQYAQRDGADGWAAEASADWPSYRRTVNGQRFSPLTEITRSNVAQLRQVCAYDLPEVSQFQSGPIVIDGTMYFTSDTKSFAIDALTCAEKWKSERKTASSPFVYGNRGFAFSNGRLFRGTSDAHVLALAANDGRTLWDVTLDVTGPGVTVPMAPLAWHGMVFIGIAGGDNVAVTGHLYALDENDGHVIWRFDVVPPSARATWQSAPQYPITGGALWTSLTLDPTTGVLYVPTGNPAPDFHVELRPGDNLYTDSLIALDATSGRMLAYNQLVKHDFHDWDVSDSGAIFTSRAGRKLIASANKNGLLSVLDRSGVKEGVFPVVWEVPTTTRENVDIPFSSDEKRHFCPGAAGGTEWNGAAYSRRNDMLYVGAVDWCSAIQLPRVPQPVPPVGAIWLDTETPFNEILDPGDTAKGWLTAYDAQSGAVRWKFAARKPILAGVTPTAGDVVFAADAGGVFYAFDADTGEALWSQDLGQATAGGIITYRAGGRQLVGIASGMKSPTWPVTAHVSRIVVYGLPCDEARNCVRDVD